MTEGRGGGRWIAGAALVALAVLAFATCGRELVEQPDDGDRASSSSPSATGADRSPAPERRPRHKSRDEPISSADVAAAPQAEDLADPAAADVEDFPGVDVLVVGFDERPVAKAVVYALRPSAVWKHGDPEPPRGETDDAGRCRLRVLSAGRYDVGATSGALRAMATDVEIPRREPLRLSLPEGVEVVVLFEQPLRATEDWATHWRFDVGEDEASEYPGRGAPIAWTASGFVQPSTQRWSSVAPRGVPCRFSAPMDDFVVRPSRVVAPAEIRVSADSHVTARLQLAFEPPTATFPHPYVLRLDISAVDGDAERTTKWWCPYEADAPVALPADFRFPFRVVGANGVIRWKGDGVLPGSTTYRGLSAEGANDVVLPIKIASDAPRPTRDEGGRERPPRIRRAVKVRPGGGDELEPLCRYLFGRDDYGDGGERVGDDDILAVDGAAGCALAFRGEWIAGPLDVGAGEEGTVELTLRRGGYVVVVPESRLPPESLGPLTLARKDGLPLLHHGDECSRRAPLELASVLGPFAPGAVTFVVRIGEEIVGEATATVRAGGYEPLRVSRIAPR